MQPTVENLKMRERFITSDLLKHLMLDAAGEPTTAKDFFTASEEPPKTFKIGECKLRDDGGAEMQIQLYWRDERETVQKEVHVVVVSKGDSRLIDSILTK